MGTGVAHCLAQHGVDAIVVDVDPRQLRRLASTTRRNLRLYQFHDQHQKLREPIDRIVERIQLTTDLGALETVEVVIENVTESWETKEPVYCELNRICRSDAVIAANTSAISITRLAALMDAPRRVLGAHFMNPVPLMPIVELIRAAHTDDAAIARFTALLDRLGRGFVLVQDSPGFVTNRAMMLFVNEAIFMLQEGLAAGAEIDTLFRGCFGHKMGPLQTADLIGLDTVLNSLEVLFEAFKDGKFRPASLLCKMVDAGRLGVKSGSGFYEYPEMEVRG
jgi:3-hydroxybutyryl-CoA dehydrogenase